MIISTILAQLLLVNVFSTMPTNQTIRADSNKITINAEQLPTDPKYEIHIVEVENLKLNDPKINGPSARLKVKEIIRTNIDKSYWNKAYWNNGTGVNYIVGYWDGNLSQDKKSQLLSLQGEKIIIFGERVKNTSELTFKIYKYYPYSVENRKAILNVLKPVSRIYEISGYIFLALLLLPLIKFAFCFAPRYEKGSVMDQFVTVLPYLLVLEFGLYLIYEDSIPPEINIRIDLMLIYPALFFSTIISIYLIYKQSKKYPVAKGWKT